MIDASLNFIAKKLNYHLQREFGIDEDKVIVNSFTNTKDSIQLENQNKVVISLLHLQKDAAQKKFGYGKRMETSFRKTKLPQHYRLSILLASNFDDYRESLKFLEESLSFFNEYTIFDKHSAPEMPSNINQLNLEIENTGYEQLQSIWSVLGTTLKPSVVYKLSVLSDDNSNPQTLSGEKDALADTSPES